MSRQGLDGVGIGEGSGRSNGQYLPEYTVSTGFDGPRTFTLVDIKVIDPAAASYVNMTSRSPLHRHRALEVAGPRDYFGPSRRPPLGARMRVITFGFVISTFGSLGAQAQALIKDIAKRTNHFVPPSLSHESSWATSSITSFLRSALTFQVRKRVAAMLRDHLPNDFLPPPSVQTHLIESDQGNFVGNSPA